MKRIAIIDDEEKIRKELTEFLARFQEETGEQFLISEFRLAEMFLTNYCPDYDMVFMDIDLPGMNGMEAARRLRELDEQVVLIFITNFAQYAIQGYGVSAKDYIVKPLSYDRFRKKLARAIRLVPKADRPTLLIRTEDGTVTVDIDDVTYAEVQQHHMYYHTSRAIYRVRGSLKQAVQEMNDPQFFICNKSCLVNLAYVERVTDSTVTVCGTELSVSRPKKKAFMDALAAYHNRKQ